ncbi:MAG TPA: BatA domain-containing protein [Tepidisphaeraceae bacterium]|jgi:hypothetical protein|nr:BatA domain-containing protein [Tepidisphaeraceae bacterium]
MLLNPAMLAGIGGVSLPLVLHLLARARYRSVDWGAMMFLEARDPRQAAAARLKEWVLLATRMLLVGLIAVALARPVVSKKWAGQEGRVTAVIILDRSYSMGFEEAGRSRFARAREAVLQILAALKKGDEVALVTLGEGVQVTEPTANLQTLARDVAEMDVSSGASEMSRALEEARRILDQPSRFNRELYVVTDRQAVTWRNLESAGGFAQWVSDEQHPTHFYVVPVGGDDADNISIESVELVEPVAVRNQSAEVEVKIRNYAGSTRAGMELNLAVITPSDPPRRASDAGRRLNKEPLVVTVGPRSSTTVRVPVTFRESGSHVLSAEIKAPGLEADNRCQTAIDVTDPIETLIISGDERTDELRRESFFLRVALAPYWSRRGGDPHKSGDLAVVTIKNSNELGGVNFRDYQVIVLANAPQISAETVRALEQRIYEGGGLIIAPGNLTRVDNYNSLLYREGLGLLPAKLEPSGPGDGSRATALLGLELSHPIFRFRRGSDPLPGAVIGRYFPATPRQGDSRVLATYASGEPFLIEGPRGRGRVLLVTSPLDGDWNTLPLYPFYLPFVQSMVRYACGVSAGSRNLLPGDAIAVSFDEPMEQIQAWRNDEKPSASVDRSQIRVTDTQQPGVYRIEAKGRAGKVIHFVVQSPRGESDLTPLTAEQWQKLEHNLGFKRVDMDRQNLGPLLVAERRGRELWLELIVIALVLGVVEMALARVWTADI